MPVSSGQQYLAILVLNSKIVKLFWSWEFNVSNQPNMECKKYTKLTELKIQSGKQLCSVISFFSWVLWLYVPFKLMNWFASSDSLKEIFHLSNPFMTSNVLAPFHHSCKNFKKNPSNFGSEIH